jgi:hypothetical protein
MRLKVLLAFVTVVIMMGCDKLAGGDISLVKKGILEFDKSLTVGKAIDNYNYFKSTKWETVTSDNGKKAVKVTCVYDADKSASVFKQNNIKSADAQYQFIINEDKTFSVGWCGTNFEKTDGTKLPAPENSNLGQCINSLKIIYSNKIE